MQTTSMLALQAIAKRMACFNAPQVCKATPARGSTPIATAQPVRSSSWCQVKAALERIWQACDMDGSHVIERAEVPTDTNAQHAGANATTSPSHHNLLKRRPPRLL